MNEQSNLDVPTSVVAVVADADLDRAEDQSSLWRHRAFLNLWASETISQFGTQVTAITLPLIAALTLSASPFQMGALSAAMTAPSLVIGLFVGVWVDRLRRRPLLVIADIARAAILLAIPAAWWLGFLSIPLLYLVAVLVGTFTVVFDVAYVSFLPSLIRRDQLVDGNSKLEMSVSGAQVGGPAIGGLLVGVMIPPLVLLLDAASYLLSALFIFRIRDNERLGRSQTVRGTMREDITEGLRAMLHSPVLRALALSSATLSLFGWMFLAVYVLYMVDDLGLGPGAVGLVFGAGGVGALIGATLAAPLSRRFGTGPTIVSARVAFGLGGLLVLVALSVPAYALPIVVAAEFLQWLALVAGDVNARALRQFLTPDRLLGRINASFRVMVNGSVPIGSVVGGMLGETIGVRATLVVGVVGMLAAAIWLIVSPVWGIKNSPDGAELSQEIA